MISHFERADLSRWRKDKEWPGLVVQLSQVLLYENAQTHVVLMRVTWDVFTDMFSKPSLFGCWHICLQWCPQQPAWLQRVRAFHPPWSLLPVLASAWVNKRISVCDLYSLLPASIKSDPTTRRAAMHSNTLVLNLSLFMLSGLDCVWRQATVKWWYDDVIPL